MQRKWIFPIYFMLSLWVMELVLNLTTFQSFAPKYTGITLLMGAALASLLYIHCTAFKPKTNRTLAAIFLGILATVFASQVVYYNMFTTFYTVYSAINSPQVLQFWDQIIYAISKNILFILPLYLPMTILLLVGEKFLSFERSRWPMRAIAAAMIVVFYISGLGLVHSEQRQLTSAFALYYERSIPVQSMKKLGLVTTMRLDVQRIVTDWSPVITAPPPENPPAGPPVAEPTEYNVLEIDFDALLEREEDEAIQQMHKYFSGLPGSEKNEFTGKYQGYNLILITAEGFSHLAVRPDVTPTLYKMAQEGYQFTNFWTPLWGVSTTDGEYVACTGLLPKSGDWSFASSSENHMPFAMGNQLKDRGYSTVAYHNHSYDYYSRHLSHPNLGYDYKGVGNGLEITDVWPGSDLEMMEVTIPEFIGEDKFHAYYMTVSGHLNYTFEGNSMALKNREYVQDLPYSQHVQAYLACQIEFDRAMEHLLAELERAGVADNTLIAISSDHYPYGLEHSAIEELAGHEVEDNFELYRNQFILWAQDMEPITIDQPTSSLDIQPTIANLMGLEYDSRLLMGRDIHSDTPPLVIFVDGSFVTDKGKYDADTDEFTPAPGVTVEDDYVQQISDKVARKFFYSTMILDKDYFATVLPPTD